MKSKAEVIKIDIEETEERPIGITKDTKYPSMYRLKWKDGSTSGRSLNPEGNLSKPKDTCPTFGIFNKSRAKDILANYGEYRRIMQMQGLDPFLNMDLID